jgi:hypothetical protein
MRARACFAVIWAVFAISSATGAKAQGVDGGKSAGATQASAAKAAVAQNATAKKPAGAGPATCATSDAGTNADFKVLVWYLRTDPLGTFQYQVYDLRKGELTPAVDAWVRNVEKNYPAYLVVARSVDLKRERGETESLKVGSVIKRELFVAAAIAGVFLGGGPPVISSGPSLGSSSSALSASSGALFRPLGAAGIDRSYLNPPGTLFPFPIPFPRPHP